MEKEIIKNKFYHQGLSLEREDKKEKKNKKNKPIKKIDKDVKRICSCGREIILRGDEPVICECGIKHIK